MYSNPKCLAKFQSNLCIRMLKGKNKNILNSPVLISEKNHLFEIENAQIYDYLFIVLCSLLTVYSFLHTFFFRKVVLFAYENCANDYTNTTYVILYIIQMTSYTAEEKYKKS